MRRNQKFEILTAERTKMQTIPKPINANEITKITPIHDVKSNLVWKENNVTPKQTKAVIPTAIKTELMV